MRNIKYVKKRKAIIISKPQTKVKNILNEYSIFPSENIVIRDFTKSFSRTIYFKNVHLISRGFEIFPIILKQIIKYYFI